MKLMLFLSHNGILSRRKAFEAIKNGAVAVNGRVNLEPSTDVDPARDKVHFHARLVNDKIFEYVMLNKPENYVTSCERQFGEATVMDLLPKELKHLRPVGRLDKDTEGLLLFTNDGELANQLAHPSYDVNKTYLVRVRGKITADEIRNLEAGVIIDGKKTAPAVVALIRAGEDVSEFQITIHEGRKHQVRLMADAISHPVVYLSRLSQGPLELGSLPRGEYRRLSEEEAMLLKRIKRSAARGVKKNEVKPVDEPKYVGRRGRGEFNREQRLLRENNLREKQRLSDERPRAPRPEFKPREGQRSNAREERPRAGSARPERPRAGSARPERSRTSSAREERPRAYAPRVDSRPAEARRSAYVPREGGAGRPQDPRRKPYVPKEGSRSEGARQPRPYAERASGRPDESRPRAPRPEYSSREGHRSTPRAGEARRSTERPAFGAKPLFSSNSEKRRFSNTREWHADSDVHSSANSPKPFNKKPFRKA
ncbi:MAG: pseudouridine synthase [Candidatus Omnitrophica bacterium]|nr:pseudouridine synthase [Candidatus Omnitrophota bacterium]